MGLCVAILVHAATASAQVPWKARPYEAKPVNRPGILEGRIVFQGRPPPPKKLTIVADFACCDKAPKWTENLIVGDKSGLANVVVHLIDVRSGKPVPETTVTVDQIECVFQPHVVVAFCDRKIRLFNSDPIFHNVHGFMTRGWYSVFNVGMPTKGYEVYKTLTAPGPIMVKCDAGHRWMCSYIYAVENPYVALTGKDGRFVIEGIPPGRHKVKVWHETLGELVLPLDMPPSGRQEMNLEARTQGTPKLRLVPPGQETGRTISSPEPSPSALPESSPEPRTPLEPSGPSAAPSVAVDDPITDSISEAQEDMIRYLSVTALVGAFLLTLYLIWRRGSSTRPEKPGS